MSYHKRNTRPPLITGTLLLRLLALICIGASAVYWWEVQGKLTDSLLVRIAFMAVLVAAPPALTSFLIPWSPGGMLLQKTHARTWGFAVIVAISLFLLYYSFQMQYAWWYTQKIQDGDIAGQQALIGIVTFIIIPALLWPPLTGEELMERVRQAHLVKRYELQAHAEIAMLRATLIRAQEKALIGLANLTVQERAELAEVQRNIVSGMHQTQLELAASVNAISGAVLHIPGDDQEDIAEVLQYIRDTLTGSELADGETPVAMPQVKQVVPATGTTALVTQPHASPVRRMTPRGEP